MPGSRQEKAISEEEEEREIERGKLKSKTPNNREIKESGRGSERGKM